MLKKKCDMLKDVFMKITLKVFIIIFIAANAHAFVADEIEITKIKDMKLTHEKGFYYINVAFAVRNLSSKDIQLKNSRFDLFFALKNSENIPIGTSEKTEIMLKGNARPGSEPVEQYLDLSTVVGSDIRKLHLAIISSDEMNALLTNPEPKLSIRIKGSFDGGIRSDLGWTYQKGLNIDWIIQSHVPRKILIGTYKKIEAAADKENGEESDTSPPEKKPVAIGKKREADDKNRRVEIFLNSN